MNPPSVPTVVYLSLGSNVGDREAQLRGAIARLAPLGRVLASSSFYETEPVEFTSQPWFLNSAVAIETSLEPQSLMTALLAIEREMGRQRTERKGPRTMDIDILLYGEAIVQDPDLAIPHPAMHQRRFVLEPLAEIAPDAKHPILKNTIRELLDALPEGQTVRRLPKADDQRPTTDDCLKAQ